MPKTKKSKRERETIIFEREAKWLQPIPADDQSEFDDSLPIEVVRKLDNPLTATNGYIRCLQSRLIFKQQESALSSKPRLMNIEYSDILQYFLEDSHPKIVIIKVYKASLDAHCWYEVVQFKKAADAQAFFEQLGKLRSDSSQRGRSSRNETYDSREELVFRDRARMRQFDMSRFSTFPEQLPGQVYDSLKDRNLDENGEFNCFERHVTFREPDRPASEYFWDTNYEKVGTLNLFRDDSKHAVFAINNRNNEPNNYTIFRFDDSKSVSNLRRTFESYGGNVVYRNESDRRRENSGERSSYMPSRHILLNDDDYFDKVSSRPVSRSYYEPKRSYTSESMRGGRDRGFEVSRVGNGVRASFHRPNESLSKQEMLNFPDDEEWESDLAYIDTNKPGGNPITDEGPVYMFVAHRVKY